MVGGSRTLDVILYTDRQRQLLKVDCGLSIVRDLHASLLQKARFATWEWQARACFEGPAVGMVQTFIGFVSSNSHRRLRKRRESVLANNHITQTATTLEPRLAGLPDPMWRALLGRSVCVEYKASPLTHSRGLCRAIGLLL
jgi:hypothetical protein